MEQCFASKFTSFSLKTTALKTFTAFLAEQGDFVNSATPKKQHSSLKSKGNNLHFSIEILRFLLKAKHWGVIPNLFIEKVFIESRFSFSSLIGRFMF